MELVMNEASKTFSKNLFRLRASVLLVFCFIGLKPTWLHKLSYPLAKANGNRIKTISLSTAVGFRVCCITNKLSFRTNRFEMSEESHFYIAENLNLFKVRFSHCDAFGIHSASLHSE
jgi:hypothetical protein